MDDLSTTKKPMKDASILPHPEDSWMGKHIDTMSQNAQKSFLSLHSGWLEYVSDGVVCRRTCIFWSYISGMCQRT